MKTVYLKPMLIGGMIMARAALTLMIGTVMSKEDRLGVSRGQQLKRKKPFQGLNAIRRRARSDQRKKMSLDETETSKLHDAEIESICARKEYIEISLTTYNKKNAVLKFYNVLDYCYIGSQKQSIIDSVDILRFDQDVNSIEGRVMAFRRDPSVAWSKYEYNMVSNGDYKAYIFNGSTRYMMDVIAQSAELVFDN